VVQTISVSGVKSSADNRICMLLKELLQRIFLMRFLMISNQEEKKVLIN